MNNGILSILDNALVLFEFSLIFDIPDDSFWGKIKKENIKLFTVFVLYYGFVLLRIFQHFYKEKYRKWF